MDVPKRLLVVPLLAVVLPCLAVAVLGYKWLRIESDAQMLRGRDAAEAEAARLRRDLLDALEQTSRELSARWRPLPSDRPYALRESWPPLVSAAFRVDDNRIDPDYDGTYRAALVDSGLVRLKPELVRLKPELVRLKPDTTTTETPASLSPSADQMTSKAAALLADGRAALERRDYRTAAVRAGTILRCCAAARDEYGLSFTVYAARQLIAAWRGSGTLAARFPDLSRQLTALLDEGVFGHPLDVRDLEALAAGHGGDGDRLVQAARQHAARVARNIALTGALERWLAAAGPAGHNAPPFEVTTVWAADRVEPIAVYRTPGGPTQIVVVDVQQATARVVSSSAASVAFESTLVGRPPAPVAGALAFPLVPGTSDLTLLLRPRANDAAAERRRTTLFAGSLAALLALVAALGYFALRDIAREVRMLSLRSNFVTSVTHELKTPLTSIRLLAETLRLDRAPGAATDEMLDGILGETDRLTRLVDNVLGAARMDRGAAVYHAIEVDLDAVLDVAIARFDHVLRREGFNLVREGDAAGARVRVDADGLSQAIANLLGNAIKYSRASREVRFGVYPAGSEVELRVTDRGIGIAPGAQRRIFERFYRAPEAEAESSGAGLGLSLVRHFAEMHGGRVTVVSEPDVGSAFSIWLPLADADPVPVKRTSEALT